jgi:hypothetical protein
MAENQNENIDELLNDIALEPDNNSESVHVEEDTIRTQDEYHDELKIEPDDSLEVDEQHNQEELTEEIDEDLTDDKEYAVQKKQTKLQKILIAVAAGLLVIITLGLIAYFLGFFDEEKPMPKEEVKKEVAKPAKPKVQFNDKDINVDRLNQKLNMLTKYEILEDAQKEKQKVLEKERLHQEAQQKLEEERLAKIKRMKALEDKRLKEEAMAQQKEEELLSSSQKIEEEVQEVQVEVAEPKEDIIQVTKENKDITVSYEVDPAQKQEQTMPKVEIVEMDMPTMVEPVQEKMMEDSLLEEDTQEENLENNFIKFIVISTNKRNIYKKELDQITAIDSNIKLCRDDANNIEVFVGPYEESTRDIKLAVFKYAMKKNMIEAIDFTKEEFDKRCNY